jgi:hypothetical protein
MVSANYENSTNDLKYFGKYVVEEDLEVDDQ